MTHDHPEADPVRAALAELPPLPEPDVYSAQPQGGFAVTPTYSFSRGKVLAIQREAWEAARRLALQGTAPSVASSAPALTTADVIEAIRAVGDEAARRGEMYPQTFDEQQEDKAAIRCVISMLEFYEQNTGNARIKGWPTLASRPESRSAEPSEDAARWRMLPAFIQDHQIDYVALKRDIDAALRASEPLPKGK